MTHYGPPQGQPDPYGQPQLPPQHGQPYPPQRWQPHDHQRPFAQVPPPWASTHNWAGITGVVVGGLALLAAAVWPAPGPGAFLGILSVIFSGVGFSKASIGTASNRSTSGIGMALGLVSIMVAVMSALP